MPSQKNIELLQQTKDKLNRAQAVFFADYQGIAHKTLEEARHVLSDIEAEITVTKNTLMNLALKDKSIDAKDMLSGPLATFLSYGDPISMAKAISAFFKKNSDVAKIKFGIFEGKIIDNKTIIELSNLQSREVLLGRLVGLLQSPMKSLVYDLNFTISQFVRTLKAVEEKKAN